MKLIFRRDDFLKKFETIKDKEKRLKWAKELSDELDIIYRKYDDNQFKELFEIYKLDYEPDILQCQGFLVTENKRILKSKYGYFIIYLEEHFLPFVNAKNARLEVEVFYEQTRRAISKNELSDEQKYPLYNYDYDLIKPYCENVFPVLSDKIKYYDYIIRQFNNEYKGRKFVLDNINGYAIKESIKTIKRELKSFKLNYDLEKDKMLLNKNEEIKTANVVKTKPVRKYIILNSHKPKWIGTQKQLDLLLYHLQVNCFIEDKLEEDPTYEQYKSVFIDEKNNSIGKLEPQKIIWQQELKDLNYLVREFADRASNRVLAENKKWKRISNVFLDSKGNLLDNDSLGSNKFKIETLENKEVLDKIISLVRNAKVKKSR